jgi:hypothetical protein
MLRASGGVRACPEGTIQSRIGPLRLFVSSDLALDTPFWSCNIHDEQVPKVGKETAYHLSNGYDIFIAPFHQTRLEIGDHLK